VEQNQGGPELLPSAAELERAIASVPGVVEAEVGRSATTGRSRLRIRLAPGEDAEAVSWAVAATLRERFGIALDPDDIRPRQAERDAPDATSDATAATAAVTPDLDLVRMIDGALATSPPGGGPAATPASGTPQSAVTRAGEPDALTATGEVAATDATIVSTPTAPVTTTTVVSLAAHRRRAAIRHLETSRGPREVQVSAVLEHDGRDSHGRAQAVATSVGMLRAVAEATLDALRGLADGQLYAVIDRVSLRMDAEPAVALVVVSMVSERGEESLLGASVVHDDPERAIMRATLDALNRRVDTLLEPAGPSAAGAPVRDGRTGADRQLGG
jgi:hypothetical protein